MTAYGALYFVAHDGLVHRRWPLRCGAVAVRSGACAGSVGSVNGATEAELGPVDWELAVSTAVRLVRPGPVIGKDEADHVVGDMIARAKKAGIATPNLRMAYAHLQVYLARRARGGVGKPAL